MLKNNGFHNRHSPIYRLIAALSLDFTSGRLDPRITFSRTTNATLTNSAGLVANAPMNLLTFSEQFGQSPWDLNSTATVTSNSTTAPDGTSTADTLFENANTSAHYVRTPTFSFVSGSSYAFSTFAKNISGGRGFIQIAVFAGFGSGANVTFNLETGTIAASTHFTGSITPVGNGWYRCVAVGTATSSATERMTISLSDGTTTSFPSYAGDITKGIFLWGAQLELGSTATTYNPTTVKNLLGFTENFDNAAWTKSNASISATKVDDIYGQSFAQQVTSSASNGTVLSTYTAVASTPYTFNIWMKRVTGTGNIDISADGTTWATQTLTSEWQRFSVTASPTAGSKTPGVRIATSGDSIYIFGAQLSDSASVDPYVYQPVAAPSSVAYYGPRFDYDPVTLAPKGLLIEEQRTNLLTYSEQFDNAAWSKQNATVTANVVTAPNGTSTADALIPANGTNTASGFFRAETTVPPKTLSCRVKKGSKRFAVLLGYNGVDNCWFDLDLGVVGTRGGSFSSSSISALADGWYLISASFSSALAGQTNLGVYCSDSDNSLVCVGDGATVGIYLWGAQLEAGAFATSYIPTVASQVTRAADSASMIGNNFARWYNKTTGTVFAQYVVNGLNPGSSNAAYGISDSTTANFIAGRTLSSAATNFQVRTGGADQVALNSTSVAAGAVAKSAGAYTLNDFAFSANSGAVQTDTSGTLPVVTQMQIGGLTSASNPLNGHLARIAYYNRRLSNTELQGITS